MLTGQWLDFVRDNHVQEGDICLFLPIKGGRKFTYTVYILRITASRSNSRTVTGFETIGRSNTEMASALHTTEESTEGTIDKTRCCTIEHSQFMTQNVLQEKMFPWKLT